MTRRDWISSSAGAVLVACAPGEEAAEKEPAETDVNGRIIDAHVHVWTPDTEKYPLHPNYKKKEMDPRSFTAEDLFAHCRPSGVDRINLIQMSFYGTDHSYMLDMMAKYPDNFAGTGVLPDVLDDDSQDPSEMMVELGAKLCYAFRVRGGYNRKDVEQPNWMSHPKWDKMFETGAKHNLALSFLMNPGDMTEVGRMCAKYPYTPVIIDHLARIGAKGAPITDEQVDELCGLAKHKNIQVKVGAFYALGAAVPPYTDLLPMIERVVHAYGPDRCMWESDCPFQVQEPHNYDDSVALIRDHADFLSASDKEKILVTTAEKFFFDR